MTTSLLGFLRAAIQLARYVSSPNSLQYNYNYKMLKCVWRPFYHASETQQLFLIDNLHPPEHPMTPAVFRDVVKGTLCILTIRAVLSDFKSRARFS